MNKYGYNKHDYIDPAIVEARAILRLVTLGNTTLDGARDLISVSTREADALNAFIAVGGKVGAPIRNAIMFRERVLAQFELLVQACGLQESVPQTDKLDVPSNQESYLVN